MNARIALDLPAARRRALAICLACMGLAAAAAVSMAAMGQEPLLLENDAAMKTMMAGTDLEPSGDATGISPTASEPLHSIKEIIR